MTWSLTLEPAPGPPGAELTGDGIQFQIYEGAHQDEHGIARGKSVNMGPDIAWFLDPSGNILSVMTN